MALVELSGWRGGSDEQFITISGRGTDGKTTITRVAEVTTESRETLRQPWLRSGKLPLALISDASSYRLDWAGREFGTDGNSRRQIAARDQVDAGRRRDSCAATVARYDAADAEEEGHRQQHGPDARRRGSRVAARRFARHRGRSERRDGATLGARRPANPSLRFGRSRRDSLGRRQDRHRNDIHTGAAGQNSSHPPPSEKPPEKKPDIATKDGPTKPLAVFEDQPEFVADLNQGAGQIELVTDDKYSGKAAVKVTPDQRYNPALPGLAVKIRQNPGPGEYRYITFAWKKKGGNQSLLPVESRRPMGTADGR